MEQFITQYKQETDKKYDRIVTRFTKCLTHPFRNQIADILKDSLGVDLMLFGSGEIRGYTLGPVVHYHDLVECLRRTCVHAEGNRCSAGTDASVYSA